MNIKTLIFLSLFLSFSTSLFCQRIVRMKDSGDIIDLKLAKEHIKKGNIHRVLWGDRSYNYILSCEEKTAMKYGLKIEDKMFSMCAGYVFPPIGVEDYNKEIDKYLDSIYSPHWKIYYEKEFQYCVNQELNKEAAYYGSESFLVRFEGFASIYFEKDSNAIRVEDQPLLNTLVSDYLNKNNPYTFFFNADSLTENNKISLTIEYLLKQGVKKEDISIVLSKNVSPCLKCPKIEPFILTPIFLYILQK